MNAQRDRDVYRLRYAEGFEWLQPANQEDFELLRFDATSRTRSWKPVRMTRVRSSGTGRTLRPCDFPACSGGEMLMMGAEAKRRIGDILERDGELLPLKSDAGEFWTLNVTSVIDALDESKSEVLRASDTGRILMVKKPIFRASYLADANLFKLPQTVRGLIYVTTPFVDLIDSTGMVGLEFDRVWVHPSQNGR